MREAIIEEIKMRKQDVKVGELIELPWQTKWTFKLADYWDIIQRAKRRHEGRQNWWRKWGKRVLRLAECIVIILAGHYAKKLPLEKLLK